METPHSQPATFAPRIFGWRVLWLAGADLPALVKSRLTTLVVLTAGAGFCLGWVEGVSWWGLLHVLLGTTGTAAGAAVLNELLEIEPDARMERTRDRPLPAGRIHPQDALFLGGLLSGLGIAYLYMTVNVTSAGLAALTLGIYLFFYTPLKRVSAWNTAVGAVPGALPPLIGWAAARPLDVEAWLIFALQFCWQMPHFLAIAWLCRDDYARGGFRMITAVDPMGHWTARLSLLHTLLLLPLTGGLVWWGYYVGKDPTRIFASGWLLLVGGLALAVAYLRPALAFTRAPEDGTARRLFLMSLLYLPGLYVVAILDRTMGWWLA